ncbi:putative DNA binding domain-containing protein [Candidatus Pacearchaeota archaeon]|nr:putative DNA binding domain-containing protein [Candidatus Pacearchaeota archaeon]
MKREELIGLIKTGEGLSLEFKEGFNIQSLGREVCAFANADGGKIILGVKDSGKVKGFSLTNSQSSQIQTIARTMEPALNIKIEKVEDLVVIHISEGKNKPYSYAGQYYLRVGANSQKLTRNELREFFQEEGLISFDENANKDFDLEKDFDEYKFKKFLKLANITDNQEKEIVLKNLELLKNNYLTNAGVLMFCHRVSKFFLQGKVTCVLFEGTSRSNIIDKKEFDGDLISNYENAYNFILSKLNTKYIIERYRTEKFELPKDAIREALMNAFIHRDYFSNGHIQVNIFIDSVEISSPGGLVKGLKKEDLGKISLSRNKLLFDLLSRTPFVEKAGTGITRIRSSMKEYDLKVEFKSTGFFTVTFERERVGETTQKTSEKTQPKPSQNPAKEERKKLILQAIKGKTFTKRRFAREIGMNKSTIESDLDELKSEGKIKRIGPVQGGSWEVLKDEN